MEPHLAFFPMLHEVKHCYSLTPKLCYLIEIMQESMTYGNIKYGYICRVKKATSCSHVCLVYRNISLSLREKSRKKKKTKKERK